MFASRNMYLTLYNLKENVDSSGLLILPQTYNRYGYDFFTSYLNMECFESGVPANYLMRPLSLFKFFFQGEIITKQRKYIDNFKKKSFSRERQGQYGTFELRIRFYCSNDVIVGYVSLTHYRNRNSQVNVYFMSSLDSFDSRCSRNSLSERYCKIHTHENTFDVFFSEMLIEKKP